MIKTKIYFCLLILALIHSVFAVKDGKNQPSRKKIQVELYGGYSFLNPQDLNFFPNYYTAWTQYYHDSYRFNDSQIGNHYTSTSNISGKFKEIRNGSPFGGRIKYFITPSMALSVGLKVLKKKQPSHYLATHSINSTDPDVVEFPDIHDVTYEFSDYSIAINALAPMLGIHYILGSHRYFDLELFASGGPISGSCRFISTYTQSYEKISGYQRHSNYDYDYEGKGKGFALDMGLRINIKFWRMLSLFLEGVYTHQILRKIYGPASSLFNRMDTNAARDTVSQNWEGDWQIDDYYWDTDWGNFQGEVGYVAHPFDNSGDEGFELNLSGFELRLGIALRF